MTKIFGPQDRAELVAAVKRGETVPDAAKRFGIARSTVYTWIRRADAASTAAAQPRFMELVTEGRDVLNQTSLTPACSDRSNDDTKRR